MKRSCSTRKQEREESQKSISRRRFIGVVGGSSTFILAGCVTGNSNDSEPETQEESEPEPNGTGDESDTQTATESDPGSDSETQEEPETTEEPQLFSGSAEPLILDVDAIPSGDWTVDLEREPNFDPPEMDDGHAIEFVDEADEQWVIVAVLVFESISAAEQFHRDQGASYDTEFSVEELGDESRSASQQGASVFEVRDNNVWFQIYGTIHLTSVRAMANDQLERIQQSDGWE